MFGLFSLGMYLVLNTLAVEFSADSTGVIRKHPRDLSKEKSNFLNEFQANVIAKGQRKPKTMSLEGDDHTEENVVYQRKNKAIDENNKLKNQARPHSIKSDRDTIKFLQKHYRHDNVKTKNENTGNHGDIQDQDKFDDDDDDEEDDNDDYDDDYDEDDDDNDEDDDDDYQYDDATNPPFKPGDFGDIRGLEYYKKPKLKYAEVEPVKKENPGTKDTAQDTEEKSEKVLTNGMFWSEYVESLLPKG